MKQKQIKKARQMQVIPKSRGKNLQHNYESDGKNLQQSCESDGKNLHKIKKKCIIYIRGEKQC